MRTTILGRRRLTIASSDASRKIHDRLLLTLCAKEVRSDRRLSAIATFLTKRAPMDLIELTLLQYRRLAPPADLAPTAQVSSALESWLSQNVCPLAEELFELEKFRELANWSLLAFDYDVGTPQRSLVRAVDSALVGLAGALMSLADRPSVAQSLVEIEAMWPSPAEPCLMGASVAVGATPSIAAVATIARRPWLDLAAPEEYFHPSRQLYTIASEPRLDQFDPFASSKLPLLGDFVTRSMFLRIDYWRAHLERLYQQCVVALTLRGDANLLEEALGARTALANSLQELTAACLSGPMFQLRECAIALVQVYNAYAAAPRLAWLSMPSDIVQANRGLTRLSIRGDGVCDMAAIELVAGAIMSLAPLYREADFGQSRLAKAVAAKRLVLTDSPRSVYWESQRVDANWERKSMLWELFRPASDSP